MYPEDRFSFKNLTLYYGGVPFFYFPYLRHSLNPEVGYLPIPGMRSIWGPYPVSYTHLRAMLDPMGQGREYVRFLFFRFCRNIMKVYGRGKIFSFHGAREY